MICPIGCRPFLMTDPSRLAVPKVIAATPVLGGMDREDALSPTTLFDPNHGVGGQPIMRMNDIKWADVILRLENVMNEGPAHIVDLIDKVGMKVEGATMVMDTINPHVVRLSLAHARKNMDLVSFALERCGEFRHVDSHAANRNGV